MMVVNVVAENCISHQEVRLSYFPTQSSLSTLYKQNVHVVFAFAMRVRNLEVLREVG